MGCGAEGTPAYMIGSELHREYFKNGRRQKDVAAILGITPVHMSRIATGRGRISVRMAVKMYALGWDGREIYLAQAVMEFENAWDNAGCPREGSLSPAPAPQPVEA